MSVHVEGVFMAGKTETIKDIKQKIKKKFNISEFGTLEGVGTFDWLSEK